MELILTGVLAILTALIWWQSLFQNNVTLFQKRMELYQEYARKYHLFVDYAEDCDKHVVYLNSKEGDPENKKKKMELVKRFSDLEGATSPMMFVGFIHKISLMLSQNIDDARLITSFLAQTERRQSNVSKDDVDNALERLKNNTRGDSELNLLFKSELPLRNFKFYINSLLLKICPRCKHKE